MFPVLMQPHHHDGGGLMPLGLNGRDDLQGIGGLGCHGGGDPCLVLTSDPKPRLRWTADLHDRFVDAVTQLGGPNKATPKAIMRTMGVKGLTLFRLKSHLQKYRLGKQSGKEMCDIIQDGSYLAEGPDSNNCASKMLSPDSNENCCGMSSDEEKPQQQANVKPPKYKGKHDKPKPWDDDSINHWKVDPFDPSWNPDGMLATSEFRVLFPQYREKYLQDAWPSIKNALKAHGIACELNLVEGYMWVATTLKTRDPYIIIKARDLLHLLARSVPAPQAIKVLDDEVQCDIIKIGNLVRNKERFVKRRQHLVGPNSSTLKALEILTGCYILVQGNTVAAMGSFKGLKQVRRVVEDCILNKKHPVHNIKVLMAKRDLANNPDVATISWDHLLPKFKKKNVQQKKVKGKEKKPYTPYPPPQPLSKVDKQLESGEYFLSEQKKFSNKWQEKQERQSEKTAGNIRKKEAAYIAPEEPKTRDFKSQMDETADVTTVAQSLKKKAKGLKMQRTAENVDPENYIAKPKKAKHA